MAGFVGRGMARGRWKGWLVGSCIAALLLGACGDDDSSEAGADDAPDPTASAVGDQAQEDEQNEPTELETTELTYSGVTPNAGNWPFQIGVEFGLFEKYGLDVEMIYSDSSPAALAALMGGSVQFSSVVYDAAVLAHREEPDLRLVAEGYRFFPFDLVVAPEVSSFEDLRGATCGGQNPPGVGDSLYVQRMVEHGSGGELSYPEDFTITNVNLQGGSSLSALEGGQIQCISQLPPVSGLLQEQGYPSLYTLEQVPEFENLSFFGIVASESWIEDHPNTAQAFLSGYLESIAYLYDPANRDEVIELLANNAALDAETATAAYEWVNRGGYPRDGLIADDVVPRTIELMRDSGTVEEDFPSDVENLVDLSYVTAAFENLADEIANGPGPEGLLPEG